MEYHQELFHLWNIAKSLDSQTQKPSRFREGFSYLIIVSRRFPFLADLAATYFSKP